ncbi:MAG: polyphosphate kinase 2 [Planctomycetota bacterium]|jgi:polyphosphate kinase 2
MSKEKKHAVATNNNVLTGEIHFEDTDFPYKERLKRKIYEKELRLLQIEMLKLQRWVKEVGQRIVILFEGRDAAGKGGTIKRFTEFLNPRGARIVALTKPTEAECGQWYFQRYVAHLPTAGEIVFFDRSWYNRAGVEPVMGFCKPHEYLEFMRQVPELERGLVHCGIRLFKLWFAVGHEEQRRRMKARKTDPLKHWKLSPVDEASANKWDAYTHARDRMFYFSHTPDAPWTVVRSDDKRRARLNAIRYVLSKIDYGEKSEKALGQLDPQIIAPATALLPNEDDWSSVVG